MNNTSNQNSEILAENRRRNEAIHAPFDPETGEGSVGERIAVTISDAADTPRTWYLPRAMCCDEYVAEVMRSGSLEAAERAVSPHYHPLAQARERFCRIRCRYDFPYWAYRFVKIKPKAGGEDVPLVLNRPQRRLVELFESMRGAGTPVRVIVLKARQWGGSTVTQIYMAWLQLVQQQGLNSVIVGHVKMSSAEVCGMFDKMMEAYPVEMLYPMGQMPDKMPPKMRGDRHTPLLRLIPSRNCKIKVGSAETPNSARGGDAALVHCTEVAFWRRTKGKTPEEIVRSACAGAAYKPNTMIVYESTANGSGNFFQREYEAAVRGTSQFRPLFVAWWQIEQYALPFDQTEEGRAEQEAFARMLYEGRNDDVASDERSEPGCYLWRLWQMGATLEAIRWYRVARSQYADHGDFASEYPSDDVEAFKHSGAHVFDEHLVARLRPACHAPSWKGDLAAAARTGREALTDIEFIASPYGQLWVWQQPDEEAEHLIADRYLVVVDIGGRSSKSDWSVICVIDRAQMADGGQPCVCAQWYGHIDMDLLAWKAVQVAQYYHHALLVIESNTLETHAEGHLLEGGDQSHYILCEIRDVYDALYARPRSADEIREGAPLRYGFHTNVRTKPQIISTLIAVVRDGLYEERDARCLDEMLTYERRLNGSYGAVDGHHDDLLMTRAIGLHICFHEMPMPRRIDRHRTLPRRHTPRGGMVW